MRDDFLGGQVPADGAAPPESDAAAAAANDRRDAVATIMEQTREEARVGNRNY